MAELIEAVPAQHAYAGAGAAWRRGAMLAYGPMAQHLIDRSVIPLAGRTVLDAGAGTGAVTDALIAIGARVVAVDIERDMLAQHRGQHPLVAGDVDLLPFRDSAFDASIAAFVINHVADPARSLTSLRRVTRPDGWVLSSVFSNDRSTVKGVVDDVLTRYGWSPPSWFATIRQRAADIGTVESVAAVARGAGFRDFDVVECAIDVGLDDPSSVVRYRLGLAHVAGFFRSLPQSTQQELFDCAADAVAGTGERFRPNVVELVARVS